MPTGPLRSLPLRQAAVLLLGMGLGVGLSIGVERLRQTEQNAPGESPPATPSFVERLVIQGSPAMGRSDAPVTVVEFSDFECPYCRRFHDRVLIPLKRDYIDKGLVRFVHKDLPLPFHRQADLAARIARCSQQDGQYWQAYQRLFDRQNCLGCEGPAAIVSAETDRQARLRRCAATQQTRILVNTDRSEASLLGIQATPTFVIGPTVSDDLHRGRVLEGALPWPSFKKEIDQALEQARRAAAKTVDAEESGR